jgi:hypothetical protein
MFILRAITIIWRITFGVFDRLSGKVHLFSVISEGDAHDHVGNWKDDIILS